MFLLSKSQMMLGKVLTSDGLIATAIRNMGGTLFIRLFSSFLAVFMEAQLARTLGYDNYSLYTYVWAWINLIAIFCLIGLENVTVRLVSEYLSRQQWSLLGGIIQFCYQAVGLLSLLVTGIAFSIVFLLPHNDHSSLFLIALPSILLLSMRELQTGIMRGLGQANRAIFWQTLPFPLLMIIIIAMIFFLAPALITTSNLLIISFITLLVNTVGQGIELYRYLQKVLAPYDGHYEWNVRIWVETGFSLFFIRNTDQLIQRFQVVVVGAWFGTSVVGFYNIAIRLIALINYGLYISNMATAHLFARDDVQQSQQKTQRLVSIVAYLSFFSTAPFLVILFIWGDRVMEMFSKEFAEGIWVLRILLIGAGVNTITGLNTILLMMRGYHRQLVATNLFSLAINISLIFIFRYIAGYLNVAIASTIAYCILNIVATYLVFVYIHVNPTIFSSSAFFQNKTTQIY